MTYRLRPHALVIAGLSGILLASPVLAQTHLEAARERVMAQSAPQDRAQALAETFTESPNSFVYVVQSQLVEMGLREAPPTGQFTRDTIRQLGVFCEQAGIEDVCARGPLSRSGAAAVANALFAGPTDSASAAEPDATDAMPAAESMAEGDDPSMAESDAVAADAMPVAETASESEPETEPAAMMPETSTVFGPIDIDSPRAPWSTSGVSIADGMVADDDGTDLRRAGVFDEAAGAWITGPANYETDADGMASISFTTPADVGQVRIYPLRGHDDQSWVYTVLDNLQPSTAYTASWQLGEQDDGVTVSNLTVTTP